MSGFPDHTAKSCPPTMQITVYVLIQIKWLCTLQSRRCAILWVNHRQLASTGSHHWTCFYACSWTMCMILLSRRARAVKNALHCCSRDYARPWFHATFALPRFLCPRKWWRVCCAVGYLRTYFSWVKKWRFACDQKQIIWKITHSYTVNRTSLRADWYEYKVGLYTVCFLC